MGERGSADQPGVLADALEALIGAVFVDGGYAAVVLVVEEMFAELLADIAPELISKDAKTALQELLHKQGLSLPVYRVVLMRGEPHLRQFDVECYLPATKARFSGQGASRRKAEQEAAQRALNACA
jgi:ribonuclease-3